MAKLRFKIGVIGYLPFEFNRKKIESWHSDIFEIEGKIEDFHFTNDSDTPFWEYSDKNLNRELPENFEGDIFIGITYVPLESNYYARRLRNNKVVLSYHEMYKIVTEANLPVENLLLRVLYAYSLVYLRNSNTIPEQANWLGFTHDDTRGCLFDMNGNKSDVIFSLDSPKICDDCTNRIRAEKVSDRQINQIKKEIRKIKKPSFYKMSNFVKRHPYLAILISAIFGVTLSVIANIVYENWIK